jgi:hypothetical protein
MVLYLIPFKMLQYGAWLHLWILSRDFFGAFLTSVADDGRRMGGRRDGHGTIRHCYVAASDARAREVRRSNERVSSQSNLSG